MATAAVLAPHDVATSLNYYTPIGTEEPCQYVLAPPEGKEPNNLGVEPLTAVPWYVPSFLRPYARTGSRESTTGARAH